MKESVAIIGGGAAGFFAAITCAEANPDRAVTIYERGSQFLSKVRISGGGRCNVTNACFEPRALSTHYPRGDRALISLFHRFGSRETVDWFETRGVKLKTEADGRVFPTTDDSATIIDCLVNAARAAEVRLLTRKHLDRAVRGDRGFALVFSDETIPCDRLLLATGGCRAIGTTEATASLGHEVASPVPSLFALHLPNSWLANLPGVSVPQVELTVPGTSLRERGPLLITHNGVSGPVVLRLSAWGARILHDLDYRCDLRIDWVPDLSESDLRQQFDELRQSHPNRRVLGSAVAQLPARLWEQMALIAGVTAETKWTTLSRTQANALVQHLRQSQFEVNGKSLNKDEFVTCGGIKLRDVDLKTMQSRITPNLYFAGELLDVDGITGGFNFQAAWTTGWIAGHAMAKNI